MHIRHILVPTDFSDGSAEAYETALAMAEDTGARLTLFHVQNLPGLGLPDVIMPVAPEMLRHMEHSVELILEQLVSRARQRGLDADYKTMVGSGNIHGEICRAAKELGVDLLVLGAHGKGGFGHAILGSVAEKVVRRAPCPVLTVRPQSHSFLHL
jgi:nucleotide-binding universal stress UspA family protein